MSLRPIVLLLPLLLSGCVGISGPTLDGTDWLSVAVTEDGADRPLVDDTRVRLTFAGDELGAWAGCNSIGGTYRVENGRMIFEGGGKTEMGCDADLHAQDDWLAAFLGSRPSIAHEGDKLTMTAGSTVITLQDSEVAEPDQPLIGTTWTVESVISGDAVSSVPGDAVATLVFTDDGRIEVDTGCNTGGGTYEVTDGTLRINELAVTEIGCDGAAGQLEAAVLGVVVAGELTYAIDSSTLTLMAGDQGLGLRGS